MSKSPLLLEMEGLLAKAKSSGGFVETITLLEQAIAHQEAAELVDAAFIRAGHRPADRTCNHAVYFGMKSPRPRHCPACGTSMWDAGD